MQLVLGRVCSCAEVAREAYLLWLECPELARAARPGQFVGVRAWPGYDPLLRRPLSVHSVKRVEGRLSLLFKVLGKGTRALASLREGAEVEVLGPLGHGFTLRPTSKHLLLVAGGMGVAPLAFLAEETVAAGLAVTLTLGVRSAAYVYPPALLPPEVELVVLTEDGSMGVKGVVTNALPAYTTWADQVCACGPWAMLRAMAPWVRGLPRTRPVEVALENHVACGVGACLGCAVEGHHGMLTVCKDGPVFDYREILW